MLEEDPGGGLLIAHPHFTDEGFSGDRLGGLSALRQVRTVSPPGPWPLQVHRGIKGMVMDKFGKPRAFATPSPLVSISWGLPLRV